MSNRPVPEVGETILVPDSDSPNFEMVKKFHGGYATVNRVVCAQNGTRPPLHFLYVGEHTGYKEYRWEGDLADMQEELSIKFEKTQRAYIKSI